MRMTVIVVQPTGDYGIFGATVEGRSVGLMASPVGVAGIGVLDIALVVELQPLP